MANYIDREAIKYEQWAFGPYNGPLKIVRKTTIDSIPAADVVPVVHGRWIGSHGLFQGKCSVCGYMTFDKSADWARDYWPHCPKCGARMDGDSDALD